MGKLIRDLKNGATGKDVYAVKRIVYKYLKDDFSWRQLMSSLPVVRNKFGNYFEIAVNKAKRKLGLTPNGVVNNTMLERMRQAGAVDAFSDKLLEEYEKGKAPVLVQPYQGWDSLDKSLWIAYSIGRNMGLQDGPGKASGTYNPSSTLPSGAKSDHAYYPSRAYDLDIVQHTGWNNLNARSYFFKMTARPEVNYVILGDKIWSQSKGLHDYKSGGHDNHVHVSGVAI